MIGLVHPWVLLGLPLAAVPLVLHLVQRRVPPTVMFPAVRYLLQVSEEHQRRLRLRHWLLLLLRTLLILVLIMAAAGPIGPSGSTAGHAPSALVLVLDDSPSSGVVVAGTSRFAELRAAARRILERATSADAIWLLTSEGVVRRGAPEVLLAVLDSLAPSHRRMDLGRAVSKGAGVVSGEGRAGSLVVLTDLQATALSPVAAGAPLVVARPVGPPPTNTGIVALDAGTQPWTSSGGTLTVRLGGDSLPVVPVAVSLGGRPARQALVPGRGAGSFVMTPAVPGWQIAEATKAADELRADDSRRALVRVVPPARAAWDPTDRYLGAACAVLAESGRLARGTDLRVGELGPGASIVLPPADPAAIGGLNRALDRRGVGWRYGVLADAAVITDSVAFLGRETITRRYLLEPVPGRERGSIIATAGGAPWVVRSGDVVLVGSRLDPAWTGLPLSAGFLGFVDALVNRFARGEALLLSGTVGDPVMLPDGATAMVLGERRWPMEGGAAFRPPEPGVYAVLRGTDTLGGLSAGLDPRESDLRVAPDEMVRALWPGARIVDLADAPGAAFGAGGTASLQGPLLWCALLLACGEVLLASWVRHAR